MRRPLVSGMGGVAVVAGPSLRASSPEPVQL